MSETATTPARPTAAVMRGVIPYLNLAGRAGEAADFYARAFAATDLGRMPDETPGRFLHVQIEVNGGALMMTDHAGTAAPSEGFHLQLVVADGAAWWHRAVAAGCTVEAPYERQFWGDDWGLLRDPFRIRWAVLQPAPEA